MKITKVKYRLVDWMNGWSDSFDTLKDVAEAYDERRKVYESDNEVDLGIYEVIKEENQLEGRSLDYTRRYSKQDVTDRLFLQEIINDLERNGYRGGGKAQQLLRDWSAELKGKSGMRGKTKKTFIKEVGRELW